MFEFLKRIFRQSTVTPPVPNIPLDIPDLSTRIGGGNDGSPHETATASGLAGDAAVHRYFELSSVIESANADGDFVRAVRAARETYPLMPAVVRQMKKQFGRFDISTSHAVHTASTLMAVIGDREGIGELREALRATSDLHAWLPVAEDAETGAALVEAIMAAVLAEPGLKQSELKRRIDGDGHRLGTLAAWLEKGKRLRRVSQGATYMLYPPDFPLESLLSDAAPAAEDTASTTSIMVPVHWHTRSRSAHRASPLDLGNLPYIRLPKAPVARQERYSTQSEPITNPTAGVADVR